MNLSSQDGVYTNSGLTIKSMGHKKRCLSSVARALRLWLIGGCVLGAVPAFSQPYLILHDFFVGPKPTPTFIRDNQSRLETLPFDGLAVYMRDPAWVTNVTGYVYQPTPMSEQAISTVLSPMAGIQFKTLKNNFALMYAGPGVDFFDDGKWSVRFQNMRNLAKVMKSVGLKGIFFDNENYEDWANYPGQGCPSSRTLKQCQDQARLRGRQLIQALISEYPEITVLTFFGPWASDQTFYEQNYKYNNISHANELVGPFFSGLVEGKGASATIVDGGEFYGARSAGDFKELYDYQKRGIVASTGVPADSYSRASGPNGFIPTALRSTWGSNVSISTGLYDRNTYNATMSPSIMRTTVTNALNQVDRYVWLYVEGITFMEPPGTTQYSASQEWINSVRDGKGAARQSVPQPAPSGTRSLSDLTPSFEAKNGWGPYEKDRSNGEQAGGDGRTLSVGGVTFPKGLGVHPYSELRYNLGGNCSTFVAEVGVDDEVAPRGTVVFQVWADGIKLYDSGVRTGTSPVRSVSVNVSGKRELGLVVTDAGDGMDHDHADWINPRVTCSTAAN